MKKVLDLLVTCGNLVNKESNNEQNIYFKYRWNMYRRYRDR